MGPAVAYLVVAVIALAGVLVIRWSLARYRRAQGRFAAAAGWPSAAATIVSASLEPQVSGQPPVTFFEPRIRYRFEAAGREVEGSSAALCPRDYLDESAARDWAAEHPVGGRVTAWYDPADPADNTILRNRPNLTGAQMGIGLGALIILVAMASLAGALG